MEFFWQELIWNQIPAIMTTIRTLFSPVSCNFFFREIKKSVLFFHFKVLNQELKEQKDDQS